MKSNCPEYIITLTDTEEPHTMETCDHPRDVFQWLTSHMILADRVSVAEWDKDTDEMVERLNGTEWLNQHCVLEPARWRMI